MLSQQISGDLQRLPGNNSPNPPSSLHTLSDGLAPAWGSASQLNLSVGCSLSRNLKVWLQEDQALILPNAYYNQASSTRRITPERDKHDE